MTRRVSSIRTAVRLTLAAGAMSSLLVACGGGGGEESIPIRPLAEDVGVAEETGTGGGIGTGGEVGAVAEACGAITVARMDWASATAIAEIDRLILAEGFGCDVTLVEGDTVTTFRSMVERGEPDLAPALWLGAFREAFDEAVAAGDILPGARTLRDGGLEGWWIPRTLADENPGIRTVEDALTRPELFPASANGGPAGAVHNCPAGWNCQVTHANLFRAHGADAMGFELVDPGSAAGLDDSVERAVEDGRGWLGYYWSPTALVGRLDMVRLDTVPHDAAEWARCTTVPDCPDPAPNGYPSSEVRAVVSPDFARNAGAAMGYVAGRGWDDGTVNAVLVWMEDNDAGGEAAARHFLRNFEAVWTDWVDAATAERVKAAL